MVRAEFDGADAKSPTSNVNEPILFFSTLDTGLETLVGGASPLQMIGT